MISCNGSRDLVDTPTYKRVIPLSVAQTIHDMLVGVRGAVAKLVKEKKTLEQAVAAKPTAPWDEVWGKGFVTPEAFTKVVWTELSAAKN